MGLIGGSWLLALSRHGIGGERWGLDPRSENREAARRSGVCDRLVEDWNGPLPDFDLIVLALPVGRMAVVAAVAASRLSRHGILHDVGSTKGELAHILPPLLPEHATYIGGHPLAGSHRQGFAAARENLFDGVSYFLTDPSQRSRALKRMQDLVRRIGGRPILMDADLHDEILARSSHLPHLVAVALALAVSVGEGLPARFVGSGLRDSTRIAAGDPALWQDIFLSNRPALAHSAREFDRAWQRLRDAVVEGDDEALATELARAAAIRQTWEEDST